MKRFAALLVNVLAATGTLTAKEFVVAEYNVNNFAPLAIPGETKTGRPLKSAEAAQAVIDVIQEISPDILGVCEMGAAPHFEEFRKRLAGAGYVDAEFVEAADPGRHVALLSRFPIVARQSQPDLPLDNPNQRQKVRRGFLDVTLQIAPHLRLRVIGVHLKSKRPSPEGSPDLERRQEAHLLRKHLDKVLAENPGLPVLLFGDFNETKDQPAIQELTGLRGTPEALKELRLADSVGDHWTYHWKVDDVYSRIDFLFVNRALAPLLVPERSRVYRSLLWEKASDHRPLIATFHLPAAPAP